MIDVDLSLLIKGSLINVQMMSKYVLPSPPLNIDEWPKVSLNDEDKE